jgi:hypothetical protein
MAIDTLFITGTGRSGTNILKKIFSQHSEVASLPFEYRFIIDPDGVIDFYRSFPVMWTPYRADHQLKRLESFLLGLAVSNEDKSNRVAAAKAFDPTGLKRTPPPYGGWELEKWIPGYEMYVHTLIDSLRSFEYPGVWPGMPEGIAQPMMYFAPNTTKADIEPAIQAFISSCLSSIRRVQGKRLFQEDNTHNLLVASDLLNLCTHSKLIHVVRDPRDVLASLTKQRWAPSSVKQLIPWYHQVMQTWEHERSLADPNRIKEVRFEDLIHDPNLVIKELCDFAGIDFETHMVDLDLSQHHIGRYHTDFSPADLRLIEDELQPYFERYRYA